MGNLLESSTNKYILSDKNLEILEKRVLEYSGIPLNEIKFKKVPVGKYEGEIIYMRTIVCGEDGLDRT